MQVPAENAPSAVTPDLIVQTSSGFMAAKMLFVATELGVFEKLAQAPATAQELADRLHTPFLTLRIVCDAMVALGILTNANGLYANTEPATKYLGGVDPDYDMRPFMRMRDRFSYPRWQTLESAISAGHGVLGSREFADAGERQIHAEGVRGLTIQAAAALATVYDFSKHKRLIDLGGGTGIFLTKIADRYANIELTLFDLAAVTEVARRLIEESGHAGRIQIVAGDFFRDPISHGYDAILLANVIHMLSERSNRELMRSIRDRVSAGAHALLVDFFTNDDRSKPWFAALMSGEFLIFDGEGRSYSDAECSAWLAYCGWKRLDRRSLGGPSSVLIAEAV